MKTKLVAWMMLLSAWLVGSATAETAPVVAPAPALTESAAAVSVNQTVYGQRLPTVDELSNSAVAQGLTVVRIEKTATQMTATYRQANGQTNTVAYLLLPSTASATAQVASPTSPASPVVYYYDTTPRAVYYRDYAPAYYDGYPRYWYPPVSIGVGFGFRSGGGFHGGGHRGGHRR